MRTGQLNDLRFQSLQPNIEGNKHLREPQSEAYAEIQRYFADTDNHREASVVLPVGCGKSGLITLAPFAVSARKVLVVAPGLRIAGQLLADFNPTNDDMFYRKCAILTGARFPEPAEIRGRMTNRTDLDEADVVVTNIHQLQGADNRWLSDLDPNYFDLILFDEAHHNVAESWNLLREWFPTARIVNVSATPTRADGKRMRGEIIYSYPIFRAVQQGFVKHLNGLVLNPKTLRYVRREDEQEVTVDLEEVKRLGEVDAGFRRSIVSSERTLSTIADASIRELRRLRAESGEQRLKIIASALNMEHCKQIVAAYRSRDLKADYIHSREDQAANDRVMAKLERHELDVVVQVRMLGEGFDHRYLSVAAVFSIFRHLSPFVQFVGRAMRVVEQNAPTALVNRGVVVFHAGANTTAVWEDFRDFAEADQEWFRLLVDQTPAEDEDEIVTDPDEEGARRASLDRLVQITEQEQVTLEEVPLLSDARVRGMLQSLRERGVTAEQVVQALQQLEPIPVTKQAKRRAARTELDDIIKTRASRLLREHDLNHEGRDLDRNRIGRSNWQVVKAAIDNKVNTLVGHGPGERDRFSQADLDLVRDRIDTVMSEVAAEVLGGQG
jgi:superfamily II DNA or RNA helicase